MLIWNPPAVIANACVISQLVCRVNTQRFKSGVVVS